MEHNFRDEALAIARDLRGHARRTAGGEVAWVGPVGYGTELLPLRIIQIGPHLYNGTAGIALFLAAINYILGDKPSKVLCLEAIDPLRRKLADLAANPDRADQIRFPVGGLIGIGSFVYALLKIGVLLGLRELVDEAHQATCLITSDRIASDERVRVQTGCAGTILSLLALHQDRPQPNALGRLPLGIALECAERLLDLQTSFDGGYRAWALSAGKPPLAGFSYGAAGICYALLRLYAVQPEPNLLAAAQEGHEFIRNLYSSDRGSWRDPRAVFQASYVPRQGTWKDWWASGTLADLEPRETAPEEVFPDMWCHGSTGIAMARVAALDCQDSSTIREEISRVASALKQKIFTLKELAEGADDLCCGHMGRAEFLMVYAHRLGDEEASHAAEKLISLVLQRVKKDGIYQLSAARGSTLFAPSLFQGISGVGYTLLRLGAPEDLPCVLLLD